MKCQILFSRKNKKNFISLWSAEYAHSMISDNIITDGPRPNYDEIVQLRSFMLLYIKQLLLKGQGVQEDELQSMLNYLCTLHEVTHQGSWHTLRNHTYSNILKISPPKTESFQIKKYDVFHISAQNINCGYSLELPHRGSSN